MTEIIHMPRKKLKICTVCGSEITKFSYKWAGIQTKLCLCNQCYFDKIWREDYYPYIGCNAGESADKFIAGLKRDENEM
jgi:hypothetical protein